MTSFIGRDESLRELQDLVGRARLVTVTGAGGIGKTRLAYELVRRVARAFPDGVAVVELAAVDGPAAVASTMVSSLGVEDQSTRSPVEQLARHLAGRSALVVVDNCEHVLDEVADLVVLLLQVAPGIRILTTSREPLGIPGEQVLPLGPLGLPSADGRGVESSEAARLLLDRARQHVPGFAVTETNRGQLAELCHRLDGMPLAIELAAARLRSLSPGQLLERLDHRFSLLTGGAHGEERRHRTLQALVDWSHELCTPDEQLLWARLSVFPGGLDLEAAEDVCGYGELTRERVFDVLDRLVAKSIVIAEPTDDLMRYRMLVTLREYGAQRLDVLDERLEACARHRDYYLLRAHEMVRDWCGPTQPASLAAMRRDHANLIAALDWSAGTTGEEGAAAELAALLRYHWIAGGFLSDGRRWLERVLSLGEGATPERGCAAWVAAWVALIQGDRPGAAAHLDECRRIAGALGDALLGAHADHWTGLLHLFAGDLDRAVADFERVIACFEAHGDAAAEQTALFQLAMAQAYQGRTDEALDTCERVLALSRRHGEQWCRAYSLWVGGICHWHLGQDGVAREWALGALELQQSFKDGICIALTNELLAWVATEEGHLEWAACLAGAAQSVWSLLGTDIVAFGPHISEESNSMAARLEASLGTEAARLRGLQAGLSKADAVELGLELGLGRPRRPQAHVAVPGQLSAREWDVARLVAEGLTNKAIAARLVISARTVDGHMERIMAKLDVSSRTQIAAWTLTRGQAVPAPRALG